MSIKGAVATGHAQTTAVAEQVLAEGGNAFDAAVAAYFLACMAEPVLASLGGGGFLLAKTASGSPFSLDFFAHTPLVKRPEAELDFEEIMVDFGSAIQSFHMGNGTVAVPGCVKGIFEIHRQFCRISLAELVAPAIAAAKQGLAINANQADVLTLVKPIYINRTSARKLFASTFEGEVLRENECYQNTALADVLEVLAIEGEQLFYSGEIAHEIEKTATSSGGSITRMDLKNYQTHWRAPLETKTGDARVFLNPPPSAGGMLVSFAMELFTGAMTGGLIHGTHEYYRLLANAIRLTQQARVEALSDSKFRELEHSVLFDPGALDRYQQEISTLQKSNRGTTHISVADGLGNIVALTVSNGEGCGEILGQTGIMLNNMLGEDDLNPMGLNRWSPDRRLSSMMCPAIAVKPGEIMALGSGGSNRIRTAILQVLLNHEIFGLPLEAAVLATRMHYDDELYFEVPDLDESVLSRIRGDFAGLREFPQRDFYFGGVNAVTISNNGANAIADPRRGGSAVIV